MLRGERVVLRAMERSDLQRWHALLNREVELVSLGYGAWEPQTLAALEQRFDKQLEEPRVGFVIDVDGVVVGQVGLKHWSWEPRMGVAELYISINDPAYVGKGYGRDALRLLLDWAFRTHGWRRLWLDTLASNERAIRSYRACGFVEEGRLRQHDYHAGRFDDVVIMGLLRSEWEAQQAAS